MSAYKRIACSLDDRNYLIKALQSLNFNVITTPQALQGFGNEKGGIADIIVKREELNKTFGHLSNDLGFVYDSEKKTHIMVIGDFDISYNKLQQRIIQAYATVAVTDALEQQGYDVKIKGSVQSPKLENLQIVGGKII